ncbi:hypothetical protein VJJ19_07710, partial [Parvimonas sp. D4]|uniref:hypothetical protein n=1 Tax=Parvimonas sp. D4 TaxID=3110690 RepID=UPI002B49F9F8
IQRAPIFPLTNPGLISIPLGFLGAWIGTICSKPGSGADEQYERVLFQAHTGIRSGKGLTTNQDGA